jgi:DNA-binding CsgD family transcriptional regulator
MSPRAIAVIHREAMMAEGIAAGLARYAALVPVAVGTTAEEGDRLGDRAEAVALDGQIPGADRVAERLSQRGVRVVMIGDDGQEVRSCVSTGSPIASLAQALAPEAVEGSRSLVGLTKREGEVLGLAAQGFAAKQVARQLGISPKTVEQHKTRIFTKLGVPNQAAAVAVLTRSENGWDTWNRSTT